MRPLYYLLAITLLLLSGCSLLPDQKDKTATWSEQKLYAEATNFMRGGNYNTAIEYYQKLESRYPFGRYAMQSQLNIAYAYYRQDEPDPAMAAIERFIKLHPDHPAVAYALYLKGLVSFNRNMGFFARFLPTDNSQRDPGSTHDSYDHFAELIRRFPDTEYAADARLRMFYLRNNLARHELHVARYYMDRGAYLAAANRAQYVVEHYQYTPAVQDALGIMVISYERMGMDKLYRDALRVLAMNEAKGNFVIKEGEEKSLTERIWEYLELDQN
jgi:outer membrane protein assembly factor BamD